MSVVVTLKPIGTQNAEIAFFLNGKAVSTTGLVLTYGEYARLQESEIESLNTLLKKGYIEVVQNGVYLSAGNAGNMPVLTDLDNRVDVLEAVNP